VSPARVVGDVLGLLIVLGIVALAFSTTLLVVRWAYRRCEVRGANDPTAILVALSVGFLSFVGGWLLIDAYLLMRPRGGLSARFRAELTSTRFRSKAPDTAIDRHCGRRVRVRRQSATGLTVENAAYSYNSHVGSLSASKQTTTLSADGVIEPSAAPWPSRSSTRVGPKSMLIREHQNPAG